MLGNITWERSLLERTYDGQMDVYGFDTETTETGEDRPVKKLLAQGVACALSKSSDANTVQTDAAAETEQRYKLFCAPEVELPAGCRVVITQYGVTREYRQSGRPFAYPTHQELTVLLEDRA